jgi:hypothetical protein
VSRLKWWRGHGHHASVDDVPQHHVQIVFMNHLASEDIEDADKRLGDSDPASEASPEVGVRSPPPGTPADRRY